MTIDLYKKYELKDGTIVTILDELAEGKAYVVEVPTPDGESLFEQDVVERDQLVRRVSA